MEFEGEWRTLGPKAPEKGYSQSNALLGEEFFVIPYQSRNGSVYSMNINTYQWTRHESLPQSHGVTAAAINGHQIVFVGGGGGGTPQIYDACTKQWTPLPPLSVQRYYCACVVDGSKIYVIGGSSLASFHDTMEVLDLSIPAEQRSWSVVSSTMSTPRYGSAPAVVDGKIYVVGGFNCGIRLNTCEVFDIRRQEWNSTTLPPMTECRDGPALVVRDSKLIVIGGHNGRTFLDSMEYFDLNSSTPSWRLLGQKMKQGRYYFAVANTATGIIVADGQCGSGFLDTVEILELGLQAPRLAPFPNGVLDNTHKTKIDTWIQEVTDQKESYQQAIDTVISKHHIAWDRRKEQLEEQLRAVIAQSQQIQAEIDRIDADAQEDTNTLRGDLEAWNQSTDIEITRAKNLLRVIALVQNTDIDGQPPNLPYNPTSHAPPPAPTEDPPDRFICPITQGLMDDPVHAADGYTYERSAIEDAMRRNPVSPMTRQCLRGTSVYPSIHLRTEIKEWKETHRNN